MKVVKRPPRGSFHYMLYVDLVCLLKQRHDLNLAVKWIAGERGLSQFHVLSIYRRYVKPQLRHGTPIGALV